MSTEIAEAQEQGAASADQTTVEAPALVPGAGVGNRTEPPPSTRGSSRWERDAGLPSFVPPLQAALPTLLVASILCLITFLAGGGLNLSTRTPVEIALTLACGVAIAAAILLAPADRSRETPASGEHPRFDRSQETPASGEHPRFGQRVYGAWSVGLLLALAALSALSVIWSVQPDASWQDAGRLFAYSAVFALAVLLARAAPAQWPAVLGGVLLAAVIVCGYALLSKIFPDAIGVAQNTGHVYARLQAPYGYWNAIGLTAAIGAIGCMWLGARRTGHALLSALAYPAMGLMLVTLLLAYSRGALAALVLGLALWLCLIPLRLRGAAVLCAGALGAIVVVAWDFSQHALTTDDIPLAERVTAGHQLGVLLAATLVGLTLVGLASGFFFGRRALSPPARRRAGTVLLALPVIAVIALAGMLTVSHRGLFGSISHTVSTLTNPNASVPANGPGRLTAIGSVRARYWNEALEIFTDHPLLGAGAEGYETARLRYRTAILNVGQAHGFIVQTLADLGLVGLLVVLALLGTWMCAAGRATHPLNRRWRRWRWTALVGSERLYSAERVGLLTLVCVAATFGVHSLVDWTWYVPGVACAALLCAGWVAGRGPLSSVLALAGAPAGLAPDVGDVVASAPVGPDPGGSGDPISRAPRWRSLTLRDVGPLRAGIAAAVVLCALLAAWAEWQPQRSVDASNEALALVARNPNAALAAAHTAVSRDPLSAEALLTLAAVQEGAGQSAAAAATYEHAVHLQPSNFHTWQALGEYDLRVGQPAAALQALRATVYLNPEAVAPRADIAENAELLSIQNAYLQALRDTASGGGAAVH
ncbi:MAG: O-antigen ligase family protein [Solirubrobacteraceae bacterium]